MTMENAPAPEPSWFEASAQEPDPLLVARALLALLLDGAGPAGPWRSRQDEVLEPLRKRVRLRPGGRPVGTLVVRGGGRGVPVRSAGDFVAAVTTAGCFDAATRP